MKSIGKDFWGNETYKKGNKIYKKVDGVLHTVTSWGEPCCPVRNKMKPKRKTALKKAIWKKAPRVSGVWFNTNKEILQIQKQYKVNDVVGYNVKKIGHKINSKTRILKKVKTRPQALKYVREYMKKSK